MRAIIIAGAAVFAIQGQAQAFTCSSSEVTDALKSIEIKSHWASLEQLGGKDASINTSLVATTNDSCRATITYNIADKKDKKYTSTAVIAYQYFPTDDGSGVYVNVLGYDNPYDVSPDRLRDLFFEEHFNELGDGGMAARNREYFAKHPQYQGDNGSSERR